MLGYFWSSVPAVPVPTGVFLKNLSTSKNTHLFGSLVSLVTDEAESPGLAVIVLHDNATHYLTVGIKQLKNDL